MRYLRVWLVILTFTRGWVRKEGKTLTAQNLVAIQKLYYITFHNHFTYCH